MTKKEIKNYAKEHNCSIREAQRQLGVVATGKFESVEKKNDLKKVKLSEIKTPTTVEEFRENLKKYFASYLGDQLYVLGNEDAFGIKYEEINSFSDIYEACEMGWNHKNVGNYCSPHICPLIEFDWDEMYEQNAKNRPAYALDPSNWLWFHDDYEVYENAPNILLDMKDPAWFKLDNQVLREFYMHVLGEFAGYGLLSDYKKYAVKEVA